MSRSLKRLTVAFTFSVYDKSTNFLSLILPYLKHAFSKTLRFLSSSMEPFLFSDDIDVFAPDPLPSPLSTFSTADPLFLVNFRWWNEVREALYGCGAEEATDGVLYDAATSFVKRGDAWEDEEVETEIVLEMRREGETERSEEGVSGGGGGGGDGDLALISEWMFLRALKW